MSAVEIAISPPNINNNKRSLNVDDDERNNNQEQQQQQGGAPGDAAGAAAVVVVAKRRRAGAATGAAANATARCFVQAAASPSYAAGPTTLSALCALFPEMAEQDVADVLYSCGDDIDAAVRRLSELRLRPDGTAVIGKGGGGGGEDENGRVEVVAAAAAAAAASGRATPELIAPFGPEAAAAAAARSGGASPGAAASDAAAERKSASIENNNNASGAAGPKSDPSTSAAAASATPAEVDAWAEGLVREMAAASDVGDAKARASTVLRGFESALLHRVAAAAAAAEAEEASPSNNSNASNVASAAATAARAAALERDCSLLKRAVALQASRLQGAAQARQHESLALTRALQEARARVQQLELSNFALAAHLRAATEGGLGGVNGAGNNNHGGGNGGGGGGMMMNGGGGGGFASPNRDVY